MKNIELRQIVFVFIAGIGFWVLETAIDDLFFMNRASFATLLLKVPTHEIYMRLTTILLIIIFGILTVSYSNKLNETEGRYRQLFDNIDDAIFVHPSGSAEDRLKFIEVNQKGCERLGYPREKMLQLSAPDIIPPENLQDFSVNLRRLFKEGHIIYDTVHVAKGGERVPVEVKAHLIKLRGNPAVLSIARDIKERQRFEEALRSSEARFRAVFERAGIGIACVDLQGRIIEANRTALVHTGYYLEELLGKHFKELTHPDDQKQELELFAQLVSGERDYYQLEKRSVRKDGELIRGNLTASLVRDAGGKPQFVIGMLEDIMARKRAEEALQEAHAELERKVEDRTRELARANLDLGREVEEHKLTEEALRASEQQLHALTSQIFEAQEMERRRISRELHDELGQALMLLKFKLSSLASAPFEDEQSFQMGCTPLLDYLGRIIEDIRRISKDLSPTVLEELGLTSALRYLVEEFSSHTGIAQRFIAVDDIDQLFSLQTQINIYRMFQESIANIVKHSQAQNLTIAIKKSDDYVLIMLQDDGKGFEVNQVLTRKALEKGMGLAAMQERARIVGGSLEIWSQPGEGTRITFRMPISKNRNEGATL